MSEEKTVDELMKIAASAEGRILFLKTGFDITGKGGFAQALLKTGAKRGEAAIATEKRFELTFKAARKPAVPEDLQTIGIGTTQRKVLLEKPPSALDVLKLKELEESR